MGAASGIYNDVPGAPFHLGQRVQVIDLIDEMADAEYLGQEGVVVYFEYSCGCGQSYPEDPMIGVRFGSNTAEFWKEELDVLNKRESLHSKCVKP